MDINNLNDAEKAALAKAQAAGVTVVNKDGSSTVISDQVAKPTPAASATADVTSTSTTAAPAAATTARPEHIPEKFWDAEKGVVRTDDLAKSYAELERMRAQQTQKAAELGAGDPAKAAAEAAARDAANKPAGERTAEEAKLAADKEAADKVASDAALTKARADATQAASAEFNKEGKLSENTYQQLARAGYDKATVDNYIAGQQAQAALTLSAIHEQGGGKDAFTAKVAWGTSAYTAEEQNAFNAALRSGDKGQISLAVQGLNARYAAEFGKGGKTVETKGGGAAAGNAFQSKAELTKAMSDPKYSKDAAYRSEVAGRVAASQRQGIDIGIRIHQ